jgi:hypothetical protein
MSVDLGATRHLAPTHYCLRHGRQDGAHRLVNWRFEGSMELNCLDGAQGSHHQPDHHHHRQVVQKNHRDLLRTSFQGVLIFKIKNRFLMV